MGLLSRWAIRACTMLFFGFVHTISETPMLNRFMMVPNLAEWEFCNSNRNRSKPQITLSHLANWLVFTFTFTKQSCKLPPPQFAWEHSTLYTPYSYTHRIQFLTNTIVLNRLFLKKSGHNQINFPNFSFMKGTCSFFYTKLGMYCNLPHQFVHNLPEVNVVL